jgi:putative ABC transport system substrate-binding protein
VRRREFIAGLAGAAAWSVVARAQQTAVLVVGFLSAQSAELVKNFTASFLQGLKETGYVLGQNAAIEYRWAENQYDRLPALAADLVRRRVAVIVANGNLAALAAKAATVTIPIVFNAAGDPVATGLVASLNRESIPHLDNFSAPCRLAPARWRAVLENRRSMVDRQRDALSHIGRLLC